MANAKKSVWETLSAINVNEHTEDKTGFTYLSWAWAWATLKDNYPDATFIKHCDNETGLPFVKDTVTGTAFVRVTVKAGEEEATELFPVLDYKNKAIKDPSAMDVNTALQRGMTKAISYLGLGAYIYAGEDLPSTGGPPASGVNKTPAMIRETFMQFIPTTETLDNLVAFYKKNEAALDRLKELDAKAHAEVLKTFTERKKYLSE